MIVDGERRSVRAMPRAEQPCCSRIMMVARSGAQVLVVRVRIFVGEAVEQRVIRAPA
ncbi:hypothetical protein LA345_35205 (plasmid) [Burkholderia vietnamiensis]|nr:hypothetical protein [Burkholderia vietnamiensis]